MVERPWHQGNVYKSQLKYSENITPIQYLIKYGSTDLAKLNGCICIMADVFVL